MKIIIYTQNHCSACDTLKAKYRKEGTPFIEKRIGVDVSKEWFFETYPGVRSVPFEVREE